MATRLYFPSTGSPPQITTLAVDAAWSTTMGNRKPMVTTRVNSAPSDFGRASTVITPEFHCLGQFISVPLEGNQTIAGTVKAQVRCMQNHVNYNGTLAIGIRVVTWNGGTGATIRGTLLAVVASLGTATPPRWIVGSPNKNRRFRDDEDNFDVALTSVNAIDGDQICVEVGSRDVDTATNHTGEITIGDNNEIDLPEDDTTTTANNPWIEFSQNLIFESPPVTPLSWFKQNVYRHLRWKPKMVPTGIIPTRG